MFPASFPDPFVLKFCGEYFAYCTGFARDGLAVGVAHSTDLVDWRYLGGALEPIDAAPPFYWAPEVVCHNGKFYMYYSCGNEKLMELRVAVSNRPDGGFVDSGYRLTNEEFAIDAHVFTDDDGRRYMFYATDFLSHSHIGTGTVVDGMVGWFELEGRPKPVSRAAYDWQVYDPHRIEKGGVRWHTVEGPTVFKYKRKYFEMFSGGNWQNSSYGVAYAVSDKIDRPDEWHQSVDGVSVLPILKTIPEKVIGPGHNSAAVGPNGRELFCVYHLWQNDERVMAIDRMGFAGERLFVNGPSYTPRPAPLPPAATVDSPGWRLSGGWRRGPNSLASTSGDGTAVLPTGSTCFLAELSFRIADGTDGNAKVTFGGSFGESPAFALTFDGATGQASFTDGSTEERPLPEPFDLAAFQQLRIEADGRRVSFRLNGLPLLFRSSLPVECDRLFVATKDASVELKGFALTPGFEELFEREVYVPAEAGWRSVGNVDLTASGHELHIRSADGAEAIAWKGEFAESFEFVANLRLTEAGRHSAGVGFALIEPGGSIGRTFLLAAVDENAVLSDTLSGIHLPLPSSYNGESHRQFRFLKLGGRLRIESEECLLGEMELDSNPHVVGILTKGAAAAAVEMVRWTPLPNEEDEPDFEGS